MDTKTTEFSNPLLFRGNVDSQRHDDNDDSFEEHKPRQHNATTSSLPPPTLTLTTLVAVFGSYVFGTAVASLPFFLYELYV